LRAICVRKENYVRDITYEKAISRISLSKIVSVSSLSFPELETRSSSFRRRHQDHIDRSERPISRIVLVKSQWPNRDFLAADKMVRAVARRYLNISHVSLQTTSRSQNNGRNNYRQFRIYG
jgi:hypothetical protein